MKSFNEWLRDKNENINEWWPFSQNNQEGQTEKISRIAQAMASGDRKAEGEFYKLDSYEKEMVQFELKRTQAKQGREINVSNQARRERGAANTEQLKKQAELERMKKEKNERRPSFVKDNQRFGYSGGDDLRGSISYSGPG